ncbi:MAG: tetratricopeptide repeat protein [Alloprevotella sp.]|nr:tetratricopeptide repeat protein [Alloprevotella sp.]
MNKLFRILSLSAALLTSVVAVGQINVDQVVRVGRNALYFEDYVLSIQYFNQAIEARPRLAQPYYYRAIAKYSLDDMRGAIADASLAIERNPFITDAYELRGVARQSVGDSRGAIADYRRVLDMMPVNKGVLFNMAVAQQEAGLIDSAEVSFKQLFDMAPSYERAYLGYAHLLLEKGDTAAARENIDHALSINRFNINGLLLRANLAIRQGKEGYAEALKDMDEVIRLEPRQSAFFVNRAFLRHELDDYYGAMSDFDYALQLDPNNTAAYFNRALLRTEVADLDRAAADLDRVVALTGGKDYKAVYNRALVNRERGRLKEAMADAQAIIDKFPSMPAAYLLRFEIRREMNDRHAKEDYDRSLALAREAAASRRAAQQASPTKEDSKEDSKEEKTVEDLFMDFDPEQADAVAGRFTALVTVDTSGDASDLAVGAGGSASRSQASIRGRVQDRDESVDLEPLFVATYYSSPTELKPSGDYMKEAEEVNKTRILRFLLQVTNRESPLTDPADIRRHFESIEYYNSYIATHAPRAIDFFGRAMDYMTVRDYFRAVADFSQAAHLSPDFTLAYFMRAIARLRDVESNGLDAGDASPSLGGQRERLAAAAAREAIADLDTVLTLAPSMAIAHYNKGVIMARQGDFTSALSAFNRAIELEPEMGEAYYNRGYVYFRLGNAQAGSADLSHAGQLGIVPSYSLLKRMSR